jgi:hypothetical protein
VFRRRGSKQAWRGGVAIGDEVLDLAAAVATNAFTGDAAPVLERAFDYWTRVDAAIGKRMEAKVRAGGVATQPAEGMGEA